MPKLHFDDFAVGSDLPETSSAVTAEDAGFFADAFAPGVADDGDGAAGGIPLPGWHVAALGMRLLFDAVLSRTASLGAPGIDEVTWPHPVRPGDILRFTGRVAAARLSASRPEMGLVTVTISLFNQHGACVMTQSNAVMVARRCAGRSGPERRSTEARG